MLAKEDPKIVLALVMDVVQRSLLEGQREIRWMAYEIAHYHRPTLASLDLEKLELLGRGLDSWDSVDVFSLYLSGVAWRNGQISDT